MGFQLFKRCRVDRVDGNDMYAEIDANDDALELIFEFKSQYFTYELWNALRLRSVNQLTEHDDEATDAIRTVANETSGTKRPFSNESLAFLVEACESEFDELEMQMIYNLLVQIMPLKDESRQQHELSMYEYLKRRYDELNWQASRREIKYRFGYLKKIIEADMTCP